MGSFFVGKVNPRFNWVDVFFGVTRKSIATHFVEQNKFQIRSPPLECSISSQDSRDNERHPNLI